MNEKTVGAILFDTQSIQRYIFSGNRLKTNIGASYIVAHVFEDVLVGKVLRERFGERLDAESWKNAKPIDTLPEGKDCYVAYIGGGNALILFTETGADALKEYVKDFTKRLLVTYPGLKTGAAVGTIHLDDFQDGLTELYGILKAQQNSIFPQVNVPYTGLTLSCEVNGETANFFDEKGVIAKGGGMRFFSQEVRAKAEADDLADENLMAKFMGNVHGNEFPSELEDLGQKEGENDIAIVHIDGNNMGAKFQKIARNLETRSAMSAAIAEKTEKAFARLLDSIVKEIESKKYDGYLDRKENFLPIRPLIIGGDDVTFICPARVALQYATRFIRLMDEPNEKLAAACNTKMEKEAGHTHDGRIKCCGGIAILNTAYPFFRGYELAEELCGEAKKKSRKEDSCWIDFMILHGEQAPTLAQVRRQEYTGALGSLHFGPYRVDVDAKGEKSAKHISHLFACIEEFRKFPRNKVKEFRFVLQHGAHDINQFLVQLKHMKQELPAIDEWEAYRETGFPSKDGKEKSTPYVDAIEMMDYVIPELEISKTEVCHENTD